MHYLRALVLVCIVAIAAQATSITTYSDLASWQLATTNTTLDNFNGTSAGDYGGSGGLTLPDGVQFIGLSSTQGAYWLHVLDTSTSIWYNFGSGMAPYIQMITSTLPPSFQINLPTAKTAIGFDLFTYNPGGKTVRVAVGTDQFDVPTFLVPTRAFFGFTSDTPVSTLNVTVLGTNNTDITYGFIDNFRYGDAQTQQVPAETPEAGSALLIGSGLIGLMLWQRRMRRRYPKLLGGTHAPMAMAPSMPT